MAARLGLASGQIELGAKPEVAGSTRDAGLEVAGSGEPDGGQLVDLSGLIL